MATPESSVREALTNGEWNKQVRNFCRGKQYFEFLLFLFCMVSLLQLLGFRSSFSACFQFILLLPTAHGIPNFSEYIRSCQVPPTLDEVVAAVRAKSRAAIPVEVKAELMSRIRTELSAQTAEVQFSLNSQQIAK